jgi:hypothetical protein
LHSFSKISAASTLRKQTLVPATAASVHGKHQPLQWNTPNPCPLTPDTCPLFPPS